MRAALPDVHAADETLCRLYALLVLTKGPEVSARDVHDAWSTWMTMRGEPHPALVPYDELDERTRREDEPYLAALRAVAAGRRG